MTILAAERERLDIRQKEVAGRLGVSISMISFYESGQKAPTEENLRKWLRMLRLPEEWADAWVEYQIGEGVRRLLEDRRGPRAPAPEDVEAAVRYVRRLFGR